MVDRTSRPKPFDLEIWFLDLLRRVAPDLHNRALEAIEYLHLDGECICQRAAPINSAHILAKVCSVKRSKLFPKGQRGGNDHLVAVPWMSFSDQAKTVRGSTAMATCPLGSSGIHMPYFFSDKGRSALISCSAVTS